MKATNAIQKLATKDAKTMQREFTGSEIAVFYQVVRLALPIYEAQAVDEEVERVYMCHIIDNLHEHFHLNPMEYRTFNAIIKYITEKQGMYSIAGYLSIQGLTCMDNIKRDCCEWWQTMFNLLEERFN